MAEGVENGLILGSLYFKNQPFDEVEEQKLISIEL